MAAKLPYKIAPLGSVSRETSHHKKRLAPFYKRKAVRGHPHYPARGAFRSVLGAHGVAAKVGQQPKKREQKRHRSFKETSKVLFHVEQNKDRC